jgi:hypothetical protein
MGFKEMISNVGNGLKEKTSMMVLKTKAASPELLLVGGLICMGGAVVTGIIASRKHDQIMDEHMAELEEAKADIILPETSDSEDFVEEKEAIVVDQKEINRKVRRVYCRTAAKMVKLYAPTVGLMTLSAACFIGMHNIQAGRIAGLSGAYASVKEAFDQYQARNIELNGEDNHKLCKYGWHEEEETAEDGTVTKKKVANTPKDLEKLAEENREIGKLPFHDQDYIFSRSSSSKYHGNPALDRNLFESVENYCNNYLNARGFVTVNDVLDALGMERTVEGTYLGWVKGHGQGIDIGWRDSFNNRFLAGYPDEPVSLYFNIHGNIVDIITKDEAEKEAKRRKMIEKSRQEAC